jgi:glycosyltransferase involved in cell wall biosynthesis
VPPEFSVIIPTRGDSPHLRAALASALAGAQKLELLLVHDRRRGDAELPVELGHDPRVRLLESSTAGPAATRNVGFEQAEGRWLALLDDDDLWLPEHLSQSLERLHADPDALLVASDAYEFDDPTPDGNAEAPSTLGNLRRFAPDLRDGQLSLRALLSANRILTPTVVLDRRRLDPADRFREDLPVMEDYELWLRLARRHRLLFDPRPSVLVRRRRGSATGDLRRMAEGSLRILVELEQDGALDGNISPKELSDRRARLRHDLAYACLVEDDLEGARRALRESRALAPFRLKNYVYQLFTTLPAAARRRLLDRIKSEPR